MKRSSARSSFSSATPPTTARPPAPSTSGYTSRTRCSCSARSPSPRIFSPAAKPSCAETLHSASPRLALTGLIATLIVGVTGSLAALGDTLYPAHNLLTAIAQDFSPGASWLLQIRWLHPAISLIAGAFIVWLIARSLRSPQRALALGVLALLALQYLLGAADILLLAPTWMQMIHLLGADLLWIALVILAARLCLVPPTSPR